MYHQRQASLTTCLQRPPTSTISLSKMPPEMLAHIGSFVTDETLVTLRLVNKAIESAVFDRFCQVYYSELSCCILDPSRLQRLKRITSTPHLLAKIRSIQLTLDALEGHVYRDTLSVALQLESVQQGYGFCDEQTRWRWALVSGLKHKIPDHNSIASIMADLEGSSRLSIDMALRPFDELHSDVVQRTLEVIMRTTCPINRLVLDELCNISLPRLHLITSIPLLQAVSPPLPLTIPHRKHQILLRILLHLIMHHLHRLVRQILNPIPDPLQYSMWRRRTTRAP